MNSASLPTFDDFLREYPERDGKKVGILRARYLWKQYDVSEQADLVAASAAYRDHCESTGRYPRDVDKFLEGFWRDFVPSEDDSDGPPIEDNDEEIRAQRAQWKREREQARSEAIAAPSMADEFRKLIGG